MKKPSPRRGALLLALDGAGHTFGAVHPFAGETAGLEEAASATVKLLLRALGDVPRG